MITKTEGEKGKMGDVLFEKVGERFMQTQNRIFSWLDRMCEDYDGGEWSYCLLSNGGFFLYPIIPQGPFTLKGNPMFGNEVPVSLSAEAAGIVATLLAVDGIVVISRGREIDYFSLLYRYASEHQESAEIRQALPAMLREG